MGVAGTRFNLVTVVQELNELLVEDMQEGSFMLCCWQKWDHGAKSTSTSGPVMMRGSSKLPAKSAIWIARAWYSASFPMRRLQSGNIPPLNTGDLLTIVTDGVGEARSPEGEFFGNQRMLNIVSLHRHRDSHEIVERLMTSVREFAQCDSLADDVTAVIVKAR